MSDPKSPQQNTSETSGIFTVRADGDISEVPSITKLLNRKKLKSQEDTKSRSSLRLVPQEASPPPPPTDGPTMITPSKGLGVQKSARRTKNKPLSDWDLTRLKSREDPLAQGIFSLFNKAGASSGLFLTIEPQRGNELPLFVATAAVKAGTQLASWTGLTWSPGLFPELWRTLLERGSAEFQPDSRNTHRAVFDASPTQWLTFIRVGTPQKCRGLLVVLSRGSLTLPLQKLLKLFFEEPALPNKQAA
jgi:hypothetical protein